MLAVAAVVFIQELQVRQGLAVQVVVVAVTTLVLAVQDFKGLRVEQPIHLTQLAVRLAVVAQVLLVATQAVELLEQVEQG